MYFLSHKCVHIFNTTLKHEPIYIINNICISTTITYIVYTFIAKQPVCRQLFLPIYNEYHSVLNCPLLHPITLASHIARQPTSVLQQEAYLSTDNTRLNIIVKTH